MQGCYDGFDDHISYLSELLSHGLDVAAVPSIDGLALPFDLKQHLRLAKAWGGFFSGLVPVVRRPAPFSFSAWQVYLIAVWPDVLYLTLVQPGAPIRVGYFSAHMFMDHGSHFTLHALFLHHNPAIVETVHFRMSLDQEPDIKAADLKRQR